MCEVREKKRRLKNKITVAELNKLLVDVCEFQETRIRIKAMIGYEAPTLAMLSTEAQKLTYLHHLQEGRLVVILRTKMD